MYSSRQPLHPSICSLSYLCSTFFCTQARALLWPVTCPGSPCHRKVPNQDLSSQKPDLQAAEAACRDLAALVRVGGHPAWHLPHGTSPVSHLLI